MCEVQESNGSSGKKRTFDYLGKISEYKNRAVCIGDVRRKEDLFFGGENFVGGAHAKILCRRYSQRIGQSFCLVFGGGQVIILILSIGVRFWVITVSK